MAGNGSRTVGRRFIDFKELRYSPPNFLRNQREPDMPNSVYKVIELVGSSPESWEKAVAAAVERRPARYASYGSPRSFNRTPTSPRMDRSRATVPRFESHSSYWKGNRADPLSRRNELDPLRRKCRTTVPPLSCPPRQNPFLCPCQPACQIGPWNRVPTHGLADLTRTLFSNRV